ncbi:SDR family oxidoreductase [Luedemannella flava]|uniref:SDR family oxidoreductase n=1 Tax=Luedemannella flava TaxID=349316 RepID=A0ABP4YM39_9ACTN
MTALVVGASRGLGRGIADALSEARADVVTVSRTSGAATEVADAADETTAALLLERHKPDAVVVVAGARPAMLPLQDQTWESFSINWHADVRIAFHWLRAALRQPMRPGSRMVVLSSGAALAGSPLSGGYAGAKATQRFMTAYAREEAERAGLGITFTAVLPKLTPLTDLGRPAVRAYAARARQTEAQYLQHLGDPLTPEGAGKALMELLSMDATNVAPAYLLTAAGLRSVS